MVVLGFWFRWIAEGLAEAFRRAGKTPIRITATMASMVMTQA